MTYFQTDEGILQTERKRATGSSTVDTLVVAGNQRATVFEVHLANTDSNTANVTIDVLSGGTAYVLLSAHTLAVAGTESTEEGLPKANYTFRHTVVLQASETLRVTSSGTANGVHMSALLTKPT